MAVDLLTDLLVDQLVHLVGWYHLADTKPSCVDEHHSSCVYEHHNSCVDENHSSCVDEHHSSWCRMHSCC